jgi:hypothetical protein
MALDPGGILGWMFGAAAARAPGPGKEPRQGEEGPALGAQRRCAEPAAVCGDRAGGDGSRGSRQAGGDFLTESLKRNMMVLQTSAARALSKLGRGTEGTELLNIALSTDLFSGEANVQCVHATLPD